MGATVDLTLPESATAGPTRGDPRKRRGSHDSLEGRGDACQQGFVQSPAEREEIDKIVKELLATGRVTPSRSPWGASVLLVPKKDGGWRFCVDYRALNELTIKGRFPLPRIDDLRDMLRGAIIFTKNWKGYWHILMALDDREKTAFKTGLYEWCVMPFGLSNAPATFQKYMQHALRGLEGTAIVYLDDILIFSRSQAEHEKHVHQVFDRLQQHGLYPNMEKCTFGASSMEYLGYVVSHDDFRPDPEKVREMRDWPPLNSVHDVRKFVGLASYYRPLIHRFSAKAQGLTRLLKQCNEFKWDAEAESSFQTLKQALSTEPVLALPDFTREFIVTTDGACSNSVGGWLGQKDDN
eukprot:GHVQ01011667.1.p1 GENE.GHVQ01011667.1~~GHVQ01011667.1.p1  ORF type:complete len:351 (+),score=27.83 GHVQ01011667.1:357-1409(+)